MISTKLLPHRSDARLAALITKQILPELPEINSLLDIGCGDGIVVGNEGWVAELQFV